MKRVLLIMLLVLGAISYGQNSKENKKLIKEAMSSFELVVSEGPGEQTVLSMTGKIQSITFYSREVDKEEPQIGLLILFRDKHYEFIVLKSYEEIKALQGLIYSKLFDREAYFYSFIDTEDHLGRSDRKK